MERNFIVGASVVLVVALGASTALQPRDDNGVSESPVVRVERGSESPSRPTMEKVARHSAPPIEDRRDDSLLAYVEHKYRYLLADAESAHVEELKRRLLEREGEVNLMRQADTDARIAELLSPKELTYYHALKDSDLEQHHVDEYVGGIGNIAPLDENQERQILDAKLRQKQRYAAVIRDMGLERDRLSQDEREYAHTQVTESLMSYLDEFLIEVSPSLTPEQLTLLRNYETTELTREVERLQQRINAK